MHRETSIHLHLRRPAPGRLVFIFALAGILLASGTRSAAAQPGPALRFTSDFRWFDSGRLAYDLAAADLDGDGLGDLVLSHPDDDGISILLAAPGGGFRSRIGFAAGPDPRDLVVLDADGDGRLDVVVANRSVGTISILRGAGDGTFASPRTLGIGTDPAGAVAEDFDGDGILDLVVIAGAERNAALFLRGRGDFAYDAPATIHTAASPLQLVAVRLPGLRHEGLAIADADGGIDVLAVTPSGRFHQVDALSIGASLAGLAAADVDRDGFVDLVVSVAAAAGIVEGEEHGSVRILRGSANGKFEPALTLDADFVPAALTVGDIDLDGWPDLLSVDRRGGGLGVFRNDRAGRLLGSPGHAARIGAGKFAVDDWNCDGRPDLVGLEPGGRGAVLLAGRGDGSFGDATVLTLDFGPADLWLDDLDGDGVLDLAAPDPFADGLTLLRGDGAGGFAVSGRIRYPTGFAPTRVRGARLGPGGAVDLVVAHATSQGFLSVGRNPGDGAITFAAADTVEVGGHPTALVVGQVDAGGGEDAVVAIAGTNTVAVLLADAAGRLRLRSTLWTDSRGLAALALGDVDGDGHADLVVAAEGAHLITVWKGSGGGDFMRGPEWRTGLRPLAVALADLDGDGDLDLVSAQGAASPASGLVVAYPGDGDGGFGGFDVAVTARVGAEPCDLAIANFDGVDGLDVAVANAGASTVTILPGGAIGTLSFGAPLTLGTAAAAEALAAGDLDGDGRIDLLSAGLVADRIGLLRNRTGDPAGSTPGVTVDVMPGTCPNVLAPAARGTLRVALVSADAFDFADLIVSSVRLAGVRATHATLTLGDESGPVDACGSGCPCDGRTPDGVPDALFEFDAQAVAASLALTTAGQPQSLRFEARLRGGRVIDVTDCVILTGAGAGSRGADAASPDAAGLVTPNPLPRGGTMEYAYEIPAGGAAMEIALYTVAGRRLATLAQGLAGAGVHTASWTARDDAGRPIASGVYYLRTIVDGARTSARVVVLP